MARLPIPGQDAGEWGDLLNEFLLVDHTADGTLRNVVRTTSVGHPNGVAQLDAIGRVPASQLPPAATPLDASTASKGVIRLAGDLGGTADSPTVPDLAAKEPLVGAGTSSQYYRGDKTWATLDKSAVGLTIVDNTSDVDKPISSATQAALDNKEDLITAGTTAQYFRGDKTFQALDKAAVGLSDVENTSDINKPVSTAQQVALDAKLNTAGGTMTGALTLSSDPTDALHVATKQYVDVKLASPPTPPVGFIRVPGNSKFGTTDFFVMKYQAKNDGNGNAVSTAAGLPWVSISQHTAQDKARALGPGYHLITEAEWMTIATDALWQPSNWSTGTIGTGALYSGHNDNYPANALEASPDDLDGFYGTVSGSNQRRTLTLSNGQIIWDIAGNVWEWTDAWLQGSEHPTTVGTEGFGWRQPTAITRWGALAYANPTNRGWNTTQGLGQIYSDGTATNTTQYGFLRGGYSGSISSAGVFALNLGNAPILTSPYFGFRVARSIV